MTRLFVSAGEPSGDAHAAAVVQALRQSRDDVELEGIGGPRMKAAGVRLIGHIDALSVFGLFEGMRSLPAHVRLLRDVGRRLDSRAFDAVLLVDYPGFHLRLAARAAAHGVPVVYYIAPQLWAWGRWRVTALRRCVNHLAVILPFEEEFFGSRGVRATFVGHPLLDRDRPPTRGEARGRLGIDERSPVLAVFPGSRASERRRLWPVFRETARRLENTVPGLDVIVAAGVATRGFRCADAETAMAAADVGLCKSGTTTLEAAIAGLPMVVAYRMSPLTFAVARRAVRVSRVSLVNLVADQDLVPEFLQGEASPVNLEAALRPLFDRSARDAERQRWGLDAVRRALGAPGAAQRVAELTLECAA